MIFSGRTDANRVHRIIICLCFIFILCLQNANPGELIELLEEEPAVDVKLDDRDGYVIPVNESEATEAEPWKTQYFKASYRHYYRLQASYSDDHYGVPFNLESRSQTNETYISNMYGSDSKIYLTDRLFSYLRFNYAFDQTYEHQDTNYSNAPRVALYEAFLNYRHEKQWLQVGGLQMQLGKVDFDSPVDILHLRDSDKTNHLERIDTKIIMPAVKYAILDDDTSWFIYWGPFQRVSEDGQSLRANIGFRYQFTTKTAEIGLGLFNWFDPDNTITPEVSFDPDTSSDILEIGLNDSPLKFAEADFDIVFGEWILKADIGAFLEKNFYQIHQKREADNTSDGMELETLGLPHFAFAVSLEKKTSRFFLMPVYSYRAIFDVPANTHIFQYENRTEPETKERNLERHQIGTFISWDWKDNLKTDFLVFHSFPFRRVGFSCEILWKPLGERSKLRFFVSHIETAVNKMTGQKTSLNRFQYNYSLQF